MATVLLLRPSLFSSTSILILPLLQTRLTPSPHSGLPSDLQMVYYEELSIFTRASSSSSSGTPDKARMLAERLPFPLDSLYADPDRKAYDTIGLYFGLARTFLNPSSVFSRLDSMRNALKNYTISATPDDRSSILQQGGMFIFKGKQLIYARKDEGTGDHAP